MGGWEQYGNARAARPSTRRACAVLVAFVMGVALLGACGDDGEDAGATDGDAPRLDLDTLEVEVDAGTLEAVRHDASYVGEVTDALFVGVAFPEGVGPGQPVSVYPCDDEHGEWLTGELDADGAVSIEGEEVVVDLQLDGDDVSGTVAWRGGDPESFTATEATGDAGLYTAAATFDEVDHSAGWVVLPDGRQRGAFYLCPPWPFEVCWGQRSN